MSRKVTLLRPSFWPSPAVAKNLVSRREGLVRRVEVLELKLAGAVDLISFKDSVLADEVEFLEEFLRGPARVTYDALRRRISRLRGAIQRMKGGFV